MSSSSSTSSSYAEEEREKARALTEIASEIDRVMEAFEKKHKGAAVTARIEDKLRAQLGLYLATNGVRKFLQARAPILEGDETYETIVAEIGTVSSEAFKHVAKQQEKQQQQKKQRREHGRIMPPAAAQ